MLLTLRRAAFAAAVLCAGLLTGGARAEVSDFIGNWVNSDPNTQDITRIVVVPVGMHKVAVHVFARCYPTDCDWGTVPGHNYVEAFTQHDVRIVTASYDPGFARTLVILRASPGGNLRIQALTEFTDGSGRPDYEVRGQFHRVSFFPAPIPMPALPPVPLPFQPKWPPVMPTPHPLPVQPINPPQPQPIHPLPIHPVNPINPQPVNPQPLHPVPLQPMHPFPNLMAAEDCISFNPSQIEVKLVNGSWKIVQGSMWMLDFGGNKAAADRSAQIIHNYGFDQQCFVKRPHAELKYWKSGGHVPGGNMPGQDCISFNPAQIAVQQVNGSWKIVQGSMWMLDFGGDKAAADQALAVIKHYNMNRQCYVARPNPPMSYWLAQ